MNRRTREMGKHELVLKNSSLYSPGCWYDYVIMSENKLVLAITFSLPKTDNMAKHNEAVTYQQVTQCERLSKNMCPHPNVLLSILNRIYARFFRTNCCFSFLQYKCLCLLKK